MPVAQPLASKAHAHAAVPAVQGKEIFTPAFSAVLLGFTTLLAAGIRLQLLGSRSLWIDEASSIHFAKMPWLPFLKLLWGYQGNMTLYYFLLRAWIHLGDSEFAVRSLSALLGIVTVPTMYLLGKRLFDRPTGLVAALFLAVHSFHIGWSREARAYSLLIFLLVVATYLLSSALESNQRQRFWSFAVTAALCFYAHIFAMLVLPAYALALLFPKPFRVSRRMLAEVAAIFALLCAPLAAFVIFHHSTQVDWILPPSWSEMNGFLELLTGQGGVFLVVGYLLLAAFAFLPPISDASAGKHRWPVRLLLLWLVLPPAVTLAASPIKPLFHPGFMIMCVPALVILAARGVINLASRTAPYYRAAAVAAIVAVFALSLVSDYKPVLYPYTAHAEWRSASNYILQGQQPGDGSIFFIPNYYCYEYYVDRAQRAARVTAAPTVLYPPNPFRPVSRQEMQLVTSGYRRVWLVLHLDMPPAGVAARPKEVSTIESTLGENFHLVSKRIFTGENSITVMLYSRN